MFLTACSGRSETLAWIFFSFALACHLKYVGCYVVGGAVMPHGALILDPRNFNGSQNATDAALALHYAARDAGRFVQSLDPEILFLVTPHGLALSEPFLFYHNPSAAGSVAVDDWLPCAVPPCVYSASATLDEHLTKRLATELAALGSAVTTLSGFGPPGAGMLPLPLAWAEVIPLYFIERAFTEPGARVPEKDQPHVKTQPARDQLRSRQRPRRLTAQAARGADGLPAAVLDGSAAGWAGSTSQHVGNAGGREPQQGSNAGSFSRGVPTAVGAGIGASAVYSSSVGANAGSRLPKLVILSMPSRRYERSVSMIPELLALGHSLFAQLDSLDERIAVLISGDLAHTWDPAGPYGYSDHAALFDAAVQQWARDLDRSALLKEAAKSVGEAKSCGYPGLVLLQGLMEGVKPDNMHSVLLEYGHPSYYGMMCAVFDFQGDA